MLIQYVQWAVLAILFSDWAWRKLKPHFKKGPAYGFSRGDAIMLFSLLAVIMLSGAGLYAFAEMLVRR